MVTAYGLVSSVVIIYTIIIFVKLRSVKTKLKNLQQANRNEA